MSPSTLIVKKRCKAATKKILNAALYFSEPISGNKEPEINYASFTAINWMNDPTIGLIHLPPTVANTILPVTWNYLDAACAIVDGINQLLEEDDYRQTQLKVKGYLNIFSGIQLFLFSYNPPLMAALGVTGAPAALAGSSFALAMAIDLITISIDFYNASKERNLEGWLEERKKEYDFLEARKNELEAENQLLTSVQQDSLLYEEAQKILLQNKEKISKILATITELKNDVLARCKVNNKGDSLSNFGITPCNLPSTWTDIKRNQQIQDKLDKDYYKIKYALISKAASLIGMTMLAVGTFFLFTNMPQAVVVVGLTITLGVSAWYIYQHQKQIIHALSSIKQSAFSFFKNDNPKDSSNKENEPESESESEYESESESSCYSFQSSKS